MDKVLQGGAALAAVAVKGRPRGRGFTRKGRGNATIQRGSPYVTSIRFLAMAAEQSTPLAKLQCSMNYHCVRA